MKKFYKITLLIGERELDYYFERFDIAIRFIADHETTYKSSEKLEIGDYMVR